MTISSDSTSPSRRARRRRGCLTAGIIAVIFVLGYLPIFFRDPPPPDDSDLLPAPWPTVADERNGAWYFERAIEASGRSELFEGWLETLGDEEQVRFTVDRAAERARLEAAGLWEPFERSMAEADSLLEDFLRAAAAETFVPEVEVDVLNIPQYGDPLSIVRRAAVHAWLTGDVERAWELTVATRRILRSVSERPRIPFDFVGYFGCERRISPVRVGVILSEDRSVGFLRGALEELESPPLVDAWVARQLERIFQVWSQFLADEEAVRENLTLFRAPDIPWLYRPNRTRALFGEFFRVSIEAARQGRVAGVDPADVTWIDRLGWYISGNLAGEALVRNSLMGNRFWEPVIEMANEVTALDRLALVATALRLHHLERGTWPADLAELVPEYLDAVPADACDPQGGAIRWSRERLQVWSVGRDGLDGGGADAALSISGQLSAGDPTITVGQRSED